MIYPRGTVGMLLRDKKGTDFKAGDVVVIMNTSVTYKLCKLNLVMTLNGLRWREWTYHPFITMRVRHSKAFVPFQQDTSGWIENVLCNKEIPFHTNKRKLVTKALTTPLPVSKKLGTGTWKCRDNGILRGVFFLPLQLHNRIQRLKGYNTDLNPLTIAKRNIVPNMGDYVYRHLYDDADFEQVKAAVEKQNKEDEDRGWFKPIPALNAVNPAQFRAVFHR